MYVYVYYSNAVCFRDTHLFYPRGSSSFVSLRVEPAASEKSALSRGAVARTSSPSVDKQAMYNTV